MTTRQETLIHTEEARVRIMVLPPGETVPWHYHSQVTDDIFCLEGTLEIDLKNPDENRLLAPGERCRIAPGRAHRVSNYSPTTSSYLLVQGGGGYDFIEHPA